MKRNLMASAVAVALGASGSAFAFNPNTTTPDYEVRLGGASASSELVRTMVIDQVCNPGTIDNFNGSRGWTIACQTSVPSAGAANVLIRKRDSGGSGYGVTPVSEAFAIGFDNIDTSGSGNCTSNGAASTAGGTSYTDWTCSQDDVNLVPDGGFSDIEPNKFAGINTPAGFSDFLDLGNLEVRSLAGLVFNTPVTLRLRNALQAVQIDNGKLAGCTVGAETAACMPSLSAQVIRSLMTGKITNWDDIKVNDGGTLVGLSQHTDVVAGGYATANETNAVQICRRVNGSGTQAQLNAIIMNWPCDASVAKPISTGGRSGPFVLLNSGSSDVGKCLHETDTNIRTVDQNGDTSGSTISRDGQTFAVRTAWAIGVQSTEKNVDHSRNYRFIKIDGAAPTLENVHSGKYYDYAEQSMQWRNDGTVGGGLNVTSIEEILDFMANNATTPAAMATQNQNFLRAAAAGGWQGGWLVDPETPGVSPNVDPSTLATNPVNMVTRAPGTAAPNTCQMPVSTAGTNLRADM